MSGRKKTDPIAEFGYTSGCKKVLVMGADGENMADSSNALPTSETYQNTPLNNVKTITSVGIPEQIVLEEKKGWLTLTADTDNSGNIYIGDSSVNNLTGYKLNSDNPCLTLNLDDLSLWYFDADNTTDKLMIIGAYVN